MKYDERRIDVADASREGGASMSALARVRPPEVLSSPAPMVTVERVAACPFSFALGNPQLVFESLEAPGLGVRIPLRSLGIPIDLAFTHRVTTRFQRNPDLTDRGRMHDEIDFTWDAHGRLLPNFHGILRIRIEGVQTRVILTGDYEPPLRRFGALFDRYVGRRIARISATDLVDRFVNALESRWAAESARA